MLAERGNDVKGEGGAENVSAYRRIGVSAFYRATASFLRIPWAALRAETDPSLAQAFLYRAFGAELGKTKS